MTLHNSEVKRKEFNALLREKMKEQNMLSEASVITQTKDKKKK